MRQLQTSSRRRAALVPLLLSALVGAILGLPATTTVASADAGGDNPLAGGTWGVYKGGADGVWPAFQAASGVDRGLIAKSALRPRVRWFGQWIADGDIQAKVRDYVVQTQAGDPDVLIHMAVFRLWPKTEAAKDVPLTDADLASYKRWVDNAARGIGDARVALVLEPDLAVALKGWRPEVRLELARYASRVFSALPRTSVYLDGSDGDWLSVERAVDMLRKSGVEYARGFALGATHYASTRGNIRYAKAVSDALADVGIPGKHAVIDTADNGRPFTWLKFYDMYPRGDYDNAPVCQTKAQRHCVTLGIPPTADVANPRWGLPDTLVPVAREYVDAYLWFGRPWLYRQASPFALDRTLAVGRTTRWAGPTG